MGFHHVALAIKDPQATHEFYTDAMGFKLVRVEATPTRENPEGYAKHLFYDTGGGMIAFWDIHDEAVPDFDPAISTSQGLPVWVNHIAFEATDAEHFGVCLKRWLDAGCDVAEVDHGWARSIYTTDPAGTMVEWCMTTREFTADDRDEARRLLDDPDPTVADPKAIVIHEATNPSDR